MRRGMLTNPCRAPAGLRRDAPRTRRPRVACPPSVMSEQLHVQRNQPPGVPPLALTGERTLPDVPEENYWFRRHLAVYEWIADRVRGLRVADLACGEGYGGDVLARAAVDVVGVDANPEAHEHARLRYRRGHPPLPRGPGWGVGETPP